MSSTLDRLRAVCLALPDAEERTTWDVPTFRINGKMFALASPVGRRPAVWCKAPPGAQVILVEAAPERFFRPPYLGHKGWIGIWLDVELDWAEMDDLIGRSYQLIAPKKRRAGADTSVSPRNKSLTRLVHAKREKSGLRFSTKA